MRKVYFRFRGDEKEKRWLQRCLLTHFKGNYNTTKTPHVSLLISTHKMLILQRLLPFDSSSHHCHPFCEHEVLSRNHLLSVSFQKALSNVLQRFVISSSHRKHPPGSHCSSHVARIWALIVHPLDPPIAASSKHT